MRPSLLLVYLRFFLFPYSLVACERPSGLRTRAHSTCAATRRKPPKNGRDKVRSACAHRLLSTPRYSQPSKGASHLLDAKDTIIPRACLRAIDPRKKRWISTAAQRNACARTTESNAIERLGSVTPLTSMLRESIAIAPRRGARPEPDVSGAWMSKNRPR